VKNALRATWYAPFATTFERDSPFFSTIFPPHLRSKRSRFSSKVRMTPGTGIADFGACASIACRTPPKLTGAWIYLILSVLAVTLTATFRGPCPH